jgi:hypothetical protein
VIELPSDGSSSGESSLDERYDLYEAYWLYVDGYRYTKSALGQSGATEEDTDRSPLARHLEHFYDKKEVYKDKCRDLPGSLPQYKEHFEEPQGDVSKIPLSDFDKAGIDWEEGDDPIWLPPEYELPPVWEDSLQSLDESEMRDIIRKLREERDELREQLETVNRSLTKYLNSQTSGDTTAPETNHAAVSARTCENCGEVFDSKAAKNGHKGHCNENELQESGSQPASELEQLAEQLPEISEQQTTARYETTTGEDTLENLNHLLNDCL